VAYTDAEKDPFSRRRTNPNRVVLKKEGEGAANNNNEEKKDEKKENGSLEAKPNDKMERGPVLASFVGTKNPEYVLKEAHSFELDIPLGISPAPKEISKKKQEEIEPRKAIPKRYILSIEDYKHRIQVATSSHHH
jgi:hypothetical protein